MDRADLCDIRADERRRSVGRLQGRGRGERTLRSKVLRSANEVKKAGSKHKRPSAIVMTGKQESF